jgi:hypothetical protein
VEDEWHRLWTNWETPPYEILRVVEEHRWATGQIRYRLYYRTYKKAVCNFVDAIDELGAFVAGTALMKKLRAQSDKHKEQTPCS